MFALRGNLAAARGDNGQALSDFQQAVGTDPTYAEAYRSLAWFHATCSDEDYRDAEQALAAAQIAAELSAADDYLVLEALAAAHAAAGEFADASRIQQQAIAAAPAEFAEPLQQRRALFQAGQAYISAAPRRHTASPKPLPLHPAE